jgi:ribosomal protein L10
MFQEKHKNAVVKNTLLKKALEKAGRDTSESLSGTG